MARQVARTLRSVSSWHFVSNARGVAICFSRSKQAQSPAHGGTWNPNLKSNLSPPLPTCHSPQASARACPCRLGCFTLWLSGGPACRRRFKDHILLTCRFFGWTSRYLVWGSASTCTRVTRVPTHAVGPHAIGGAGHAVDRLKRWQRFGSGSWPFSSHPGDDGSEVQHICAVPRGGPVAARLLSSLKAVMRLLVILSPAVVSVQFVAALPLGGLTGKEKNNDKQSPARRT